MKETFSSEKEKIICKGVMEVAGTQLYERCNIAQYYTVNDVIPVSSFLSSQSVTLGSRYKNICKLCNGQQILGAYNVHYEKTGFHCRSTGMTPLLHSKLQRSYNCVSATRMTPSRCPLKSKKFHSSQN